MLNKSNLVLIGYRAAGKSYLGRNLAKKLSYNFIQTDLEIERLIGTSIAKFVAEYSWEAFREKERRVLEKFHQHRNTLFDFGGGAILHQAVMEKYKQNSIFLFIQVKPNILISRISSNPHRPRLTSDSEENQDYLASLTKEVETTLKERLPLYEKYADFTITNNEPFSHSIAQKKIDEVIKKYNTIKIAKQN